MYPFFQWKFYHFAYLLILEGVIVRISNYDYDKYFSIDAWVKSGGPDYSKVKEKYRSTTWDNDIDESDEIYIVELI